MSLPAFLVSLSLVLGALALGSSTALAIAAVMRSLGGWTRWPVSVLAKAVGLFPLSALVWSAVGLWVGHWGLSISSLMPAHAALDATDFASKIAHLIWWWMPPLFLLSVPVAAQLLSATCVGEHRPWYRQVRLAGCWAVFLLPVVEEAFHLPGAVAGLIPALHSPSSGSVLLLVMPVAALVVIWGCIASAWPRQPVPHRPTATDKVREGAVAIGLPPAEVWKRHLLRDQLRRSIATLASLAACGLSLWAAYGCPGHAAEHERLQAALHAALNTPAAPLLAAWPYAFCALLLWLLGRIILPRHR